MNNEIKELLEHIEILDNTDYILHSDKAKALLNYITNLQERKITKEDVDKYFEENMCVSFDKFIENWKEQEEWAKYLQNENEELKGQKKKAIEYIQNNKLYTFKYDDEEMFEITTDKIAKDNLLKILGGDEE